MLNEPARLFLCLLVVLTFGPVACASHPPPEPLAATRDALSGLDEFGGNDWPRVDSPNLDVH